MGPARTSSLAGGAGGGASDAEAGAFCSVASAGGAPEPGGSLRPPPPFSPDPPSKASGRPPCGSGGWSRSMASGPQSMRRVSWPGTGIRCPVPATRVKVGISTPTASATPWLPGAGSPRFQRSRTKV